VDRSCGDAEAWGSEVRRVEVTKMQRCGGSNSQRCGGAVGQSHGDDVEAQWVRVTVATRRHDGRKQR
jgi:hypothetical protein